MFSTYIYGTTSSSSWQPTYLIDDILMPYRERLDAPVSSVAHRDQVVSKLLHNGGGLTSLHTSRVVSNQDGLLRSHSNDALGVVLTIDRAVICLDQKVLLSLDVQPLRLELRRVVIALCQLLDLTSSKNQVLRLCPLRITSPGVQSCSVNLTSGNEVIGIR